MSVWRQCIARAGRGLNPASTGSKTPPPTTWVPDGADEGGTNGLLREGLFPCRERGRRSRVLAAQRTAAARTRLRRDPARAAGDGPGAARPTGPVPTESPGDA